MAAGCFVPISEGKPRVTQTRVSVPDLAQRSVAPAQAGIQMSVATESHCVHCYVGRADATVFDGPRPTRVPLIL